MSSAGSLVKSVLFGAARGGGKNQAAHKNRREPPSPEKAALPYSLITGSTIGNLVHVEIRPTVPHQEQFFWGIEGSWEVNNRLPWSPLQHSIHLLLWLPLSSKRTSLSPEEALGLCHLHSRWEDTGKGSNGTGQRSDKYPIVPFVSDSVSYLLNMYSIHHWYLVMRPRIKQRDFF